MPRRLRRGEPAKEYNERAGEARDILVNRLFSTRIFSSSTRGAARRKWYCRALSNRAATAVSATLSGRDERPSRLFKRRHRNLPSRQSRDDPHHSALSKQAEWGESDTSIRLDRQKKDRTADMLSNIANFCYKLKPLKLRFSLPLNHHFIAFKPNRHERLSPIPCLVAGNCLQARQTCRKGIRIYFQHWVHAHEEDRDNYRAFRPSGYDAALRGREGFEIRKDGSFHSLPHRRC